MIALADDDCTDVRPRCEPSGSSERVQHTHDDVEGWFSAPLPSSDLNVVAKNAIGVEEDPTTRLISPKPMQPQFRSANHLARLENIESRWLTEIVVSDCVPEEGSPVTAE